MQSMQDQLRREVAAGTPLLQSQGGLPQGRSQAVLPSLQADPVPNQASPSFSKVPSLGFPPFPPHYLTQLEGQLRQQERPEMMRRIDLGVGDVLPPAGISSPQTIAATDRELQEAQDRSRSQRRLQEQLRLGDLARVGYSSDPGVGVTGAACRFGSLSAISIATDVSWTEPRCQFPCLGTSGATRWLPFGSTYQHGHVVDEFISSHHASMELSRELIAEIRKGSESEVSAANARTETAKAEAKAAMLQLEKAKPTSKPLLNFEHYKLNRQKRQLKKNQGSSELRLQRPQAPRPSCLLSRIVDKCNLCAKPRGLPQPSPAVSKEVVEQLTSMTCFDPSPKR